MKGSLTQFHKYHVIKVIPTDAVQATVDETEEGYIVTAVGERMQWETIDSREEMEMHLLARNKRHLQQVTKENGILMQEWFQQLIGKDGYSDEGSKVLTGCINWKEIPDTPEVKSWLQAVIQTSQEAELPRIRVQ